MHDLPRQKLCDLIENHGPGILDDWQRCQAWLRSSCPDDKREVNVLLAALKERVPQELIASGNEDVAIHRLTNELALSEEAARWAVESWMQALAGAQRLVGAAVTNPGSSPIG